MFIAFGGATRPDITLGGHDPITAIYGFRPTTAVWHHLGSLKNPRWLGGAIAIDDSKVMVVGHQKEQTVGEMCEVTDGDNPTIECIGVGDI